MIDIILVDEKDVMYLKVLISMFTNIKSIEVKKKIWDELTDYVFKTDNNI